jgi:hypothetical protein
VGYVYIDLVRMVCVFMCVNYMDGFLSCRVLMMELKFRTVGPCCDGLNG